MQKILSCLQKSKSTGKDNRGRNTWKACCPAHSDSDPSLLITEADNMALFYCRSGCDQSSIMAALQGLGLTPKDLHWDKDWKPKAKPVFDTYHQALVMIGQNDLKAGKRLIPSDKAAYKDAKLRELMQREAVA